MMPAERGFENAVRSVFLIVPLRVPITMKRLPVFLGELLHAQQRRDLLALGHVDEIGDRLALAAAADFRHVVDAQPVALAAVREDQDVGVRVGDEQVLARRPLRASACR